MLTMELNIFRFSFLQNLIEHYGSTYLQKPKNTAHFCKLILSNGPSARSVDLQKISIKFYVGNFKKALSLGALRKVTSYDHTTVSRSAMGKSKPVS